MNPFASSRSFTPMGIPASFPTSSPFCILASKLSAWARASSWLVEQNAFIS